MHIRLLVVAALALGLGACRNSCQRLCDEIRDFASDECGKDWDRAAFRQCLADNNWRATTGDGRGSCRDSVGRVAEEWTCDDIEVYFDAPAGDTGTSE